MDPISFHRELFALSTVCFWIVNMAPIATLSCKESFTISHYLNRFVSIHTRRPLKGKIRNLNCTFFHFFTSVAHSWATRPTRECTANATIQLYTRTNIQLRWSPVAQSTLALARLWAYRISNLFSNQPLPINCTEKISTMKSTSLEQQWVHCFSISLSPHYDWHMTKLTEVKPELCFITCINSMI